MRFADGFIAGFERHGVDQRAQNGGAEQALAHGGLAIVERVKKRGATVLPGKERFD